ncbi:hypothetical protein L208DRAFT_1410150 [Tricholoma matsutake]|nr:hypothetical protein L208DRAFT_1410150 [Tricholoma matsutake 945]
MHLLPIIFFTTLTVLSLAQTTLRTTTPSKKFLDSIANSFVEKPEICPEKAEQLEIRLILPKGSARPNYRQDAKTILRGEAITRTYLFGAESTDDTTNQLWHKKFEVQLEWKGTGDNQELLKADVKTAISEVDAKDYSAMFRRTALSGTAQKEKGKREDTHTPSLVWSGSLRHSSEPRT